MVTVSAELPAQTEARLRRVYADADVRWLPGRWAFVEGADADHRTDAIARVHDDGRASALVPADPAGGDFEVFRVVLPRGRDDSGFVGWLCTHVKARTGSGVFVVCGQDTPRGGIFDYYGVPVPAAPDVRTLLGRLAGADGLDGAVLRATRPAPGSRLSAETLFSFTQDGDRLSARYGGGQVADGWLMGDLDPTGAAGAFSYVQRLVDGTVQRGSSRFELDRTDPERPALVEHFTWDSEPGGGVNRLEQVD